MNNYRLRRIALKRVSADQTELLPLDSVLFDGDGGPAVYHVDWNSDPDLVYVTILEREVVDGQA